VAPPVADSPAPITQDPPAAAIAPTPTLVAAPVPDSQSSGNDTDPPVAAPMMM
jgi:hypothetical protein